MIKNPYIITIPKIPAKQGHLSFIDMEGDLPIEVKRFYWIYDTQEGTERGNHVHLNSDRIIVCLQGSASVLLENTTGEIFKFLLDDPAQVLYLPRLHWLNLKLSGSSILLAASSCTFKNDITLNDYAAFKNYQHHTSKNL